MKRISSILCLTFSLVILYSCSDKKDLIGKSEDIIKLSTKAVDFNSGIDSVSITTEGDWWWVHDITIDETSYTFHEGLGPEIENYSITDDYFVVERRHKTTLFIKVMANLSSNQRIITVGLEAGDYFDRVTITQAGN